MTDQTALIIYRPKTLAEIQETGKMMVASGYFPGVKSVSQAAVKIMMGAELGFNAVVSMKSIYIIDSKPTIGGDLIASKIKSSGKYRYTVKEHTDTSCVIVFFERIDGVWEQIGTSKFDEEDARRADLLSKKNWQRYPRNMYFNRAIANGQRWYCPDVFEGGGTVYTPDELNADVDADGNIIEGTAREIEPPSEQQQPEPPTPSSPAMTWRPELINAIATLGSIDTKTASNGLYLRNAEGAFTDAELEDEWAILDKVEGWLLQKDDHRWDAFDDQEREPLPPCVVRNLLGELTLAHAYNGKANKEERAKLQETYNFYIDAGKTLNDLTHWLFDCSLDNISKNQKEALEGWLTFTDQKDGSVLTSTVAEQELNAVLTHLEELDSLTDAVGPRD